MLIAGGAELGQADSDTRTPLLNACIYPGDPAVVRLLLLHSAPRRMYARDEMQLQRLFDEIDTDGNRTVSKDELIAFAFPPAAAAAPHAIAAVHRRRRL